jgi:hypothetical protein
LQHLRGAISIALLRRYNGAITALLRRYYGAITALLLMHHLRGAISIKRRVSIK